MNKSIIDSTLGGAFITAIGSSALLGLWGYTIPLGILFYKFLKERY